MTGDNDKAIDDSKDCCASCQSPEDDQLTIPGEVLRQLINISEDSQGLLPLWRNAFYLAKENHILASEVRKLSYVHTIALLKHRH